MSNGFPPESTNAAILHARQCLATIGDTQTVQIGREHLQWLVEAATAYEAYERQCAWVQGARVGPLGWHVARIMTDLIYAAYPALRPAIAAHREEVADGQGAVTHMATDAAEARARLRDTLSDADQLESMFCLVKSDDIRAILATAEAASGAGEREAFMRGAEAMQRALADALCDHLNPRAASIANATPVPDYRS